MQYAFGKEDVSKFLDITVLNNSKGQQAFKVHCSNAIANA